MRKYIKMIVLSLIFVLVFSIAFVACNDEPDDNVEPGFYTLQEAYDNQYISNDDLLNIAYHYNLPYVEMYGLNWEDLGVAKDFRAKEVGDLNKSCEDGILQTALNNWIATGASGEISDFEVQEYYGTYNGYCVVIINNKRLWSTQVKREDIKIVGITFYNMGNVIRVWKNT